MSACLAPCLAGSPPACCFQPPRPPSSWRAAASDPWPCAPACCVASPTRWARPRRRPTLRTLLQTAWWRRCRPPALGRPQVRAQVCALEAPSQGLRDQKHPCPAGRPAACAVQLGGFALRRLEWWANNLLPPPRLPPSASSARTAAQSVRSSVQLSSVASEEAASAAAASASSLREEQHLAAASAHGRTSSCRSIVQELAFADASGALLGPPPLLLWGLPC